MGHVKGMFCMSINCIALGKRISFYRLKFNMTQEKLADLTDCSREYIAYLESGAKTPSLPILINLANVLHISVDELLVDSLDYSISSSDSDLHRLLLDCSEVEQTVIIRMAKELKATLVSLGMQAIAWLMFSSIARDWIPPLLKNAAIWFKLFPMAANSRVIASISSGWT